MRARSAGEIASAVGGHVVAASANEERISGAAVDSRRVRPGDVFFALEGEHGDGHRYVSDAFNGGARAAVVRRGFRVREQTGSLIEVDDPGRALLDLARTERSSLAATVVGITGSTGKTCTKDLTAAVLATRLNVVASQASFNNEVGLPLTILATGDNTDVIVCEMGSRGRGHIRLLCEVARPSIGVVTNVGVAHMELFGSPEVLANAKAELPEGLPADGTAVLNADDPVVRTYRSRTAAASLMFGSSEEADVRAENVIVAEDTGRASFRLVLPEGAADVTLAVAGEHMVWNALAAAGVGSVLGLEAAEIAEGLSSASVSAGRMEVVETPAGVRLINDAYNANPTSMSAALKAARSLARGGRCIAVLGRMAELGPISADEHARIGELLVRIGIDVLIAVGDEARTIAIGAEREGMERDRIVNCSDWRDAVDAVVAVARAGDVVLVKASRAERLERVAEALLASGVLGSQEGQGTPSRSSEVSA